MELLIIIGVLIWALIKRPSSNANSQSSSVVRPDNSNLLRIVASYQKKAKSKEQKQIVDDMLRELEQHGYGVVDSPNLGQSAGNVPATAAASAASLPGTTTTFTPTKTVEKKPVDNAIILLYFGAFLFVASAGLFVAFGGLPGEMRTLVVAIVAAVMYLSGIWMFKNSSKLKDAGLAFAGIGITVAPFVGVAAYNFVFNRSEGPQVWLATSLLCLGMYVHALFVIKKSLLNYLLIFTFLSLILSGISTIEAPIYYYGWALALVGMLLSVLRLRKGSDEEFNAASGNSAAVFMPIAVFTSLFMVGEHGQGQLGASLLLAAIYYAMEFAYGTPRRKPEAAIVSQVTATAAVGVLAFQFWSQSWAVALTLLGFNSILLAILMVRGRQSEHWHNFATVILASLGVAMLLGLAVPAVLIILLVSLVISSLCIWLKQRRNEVYGVAVVAWLLLPFVIGLYWLDPKLSSTQLAVLVGVFTALQWLPMLFGRLHSNRQWREVAGHMMLIASVGFIATAFAVGAAASLIAVVLLALMLVILAEVHQEKIWALVASLVLASAIARTHQEHYWFAVSVGLGVVTHIALTLRYRLELIRWIGTVIWLLLPVALGSSVFEGWHAAHYTWAYTVSVLGMILARAIATGRVFISSKVAMASYAKSASVAYVVGYLVSILIALFCSLSSDNSQLHTSLYLSVLVIITWLLASKVERQVGIYVALPIVLQALLLSIIRPDIEDSVFGAYLVMSASLSAIGYTLFNDSEEGESGGVIRDGSLAMLLIAPMSYTATNQTHVVMPLALLVFAGLLLHRTRHGSQGNKELYGGIGLLAIWWLMGHFGVRNPQAYTHVLAALFAVYAYIRSARGERDASDQYLLIMLATATIPLIIQAVSGQSGDLYGWWLLLEQVGFMMLGMAIGRSVVTKWGLYVAVGAVVYQLRDLQWAALTVLAVFLISLAVYRLQKQNVKNENEPTDTKLPNEDETPKEGEKS